MDTTEQIAAQAAQYLSAASSIVCLTGAGVSAESGVPTFRDAQTGLWSRFDAEELASPQGFERDPGLVWRWYMGRLGQLEEAAPNPGHTALAQLEGICERFLLVTQNVDDLHEQAGSVDVIHLHGSLLNFRCVSCSAPHNLTEEQRRADSPPACGVCGDLVRPDVVWFGEGLPWEAVETAAEAAQACDLMLVVGTSGLVYPAAQLPLIAQRAGAKVIDVNPEPGPISSVADLFLQGKSGEILPAVVRAVADQRADV
ncbi:MAG: NAD-dependent deacylase [Caldilineaceae bacterium]|nr:NAD-dependent deacylase [Caldilineaceae bacterium]